MVKDNKTLKQLKSMLNRMPKPYIEKLTKSLAKRTNANQQKKSLKVLKPYCPEINQLNYDNLKLLVSIVKSITE